MKGFFTKTKQVHFFKYLSYGVKSFSIDTRKEQFC